MLAAHQQLFRTPPLASNPMHVSETSVRRLVLVCLRATTDSLRLNLLAIYPSTGFTRGNDLLLIRQPSLSAARRLRRFSRDRLPRYSSPPSSSKCMTTEHRLDRFCEYNSMAPTSLSSPHLSYTFLGVALIASLCSYESLGRSWTGLHPSSKSRSYSVAKGHRVRQVRHGKSFHV